MLKGIVLACRLACKDACEFAQYFFRRSQLIVRRRAQRANLTARVLSPKTNHGTTVCVREAQVTSRCFTMVVLSLLLNEETREDAGPRRMLREALGTNPRA